jgi:uncharacterized damage-inducible protein DinB
MSWTSPPPDAVVDTPMTGDERAILEGCLGWQRTTLLRICAGLDAEQLAARPVAPSTLSLLGLVRHLAKVERIWLRQRVSGDDLVPLFGGAGDDTDFEDVDATSAQLDVAELRSEWQAADRAVAGLPLSHEIEVHGELMSLRMIYLHLIGEYARHNGHADLLRQALDGVTGR